MGLEQLLTFKFLGFHQSSSKEYMQKLGERDLKESLSERDRKLWRLPGRISTHEVYEFITIP